MLVIPSDFVDREYPYEPVEPDEGRARETRVVRMRLPVPQPK